MGAVRKAWGKGKVEVLALKGEIITLFDQGMNQSEIYNLLTTQGQLKVGFSTFCRHAADLRNNSQAPPSPDRVQRETNIASNAVIDSSLAQLRERVKPASSNPRKFDFDQTMDVKALMEKSDDDTDSTT